MIEVDASIGDAVNGTLEGGTSATNGPIFIAAAEHYAKEWLRLGAPRSVSG